MCIPEGRNTLLIIYYQHIKGCAMKMRSHRAIPYDAMGATSGSTGIAIDWESEYHEE